MASISARAPCLVVASSSARTRVKRSSAGRSGATPATFTKSSSILTSSSTRNVRCQLSFDEGDDTTNKTLNSLDAILQGSQDEPKYDGPDTVRERIHTFRATQREAKQQRAFFSTGNCAAFPPHPPFSRRSADLDWLLENPLFILFVFFSAQANEKANKEGERKPGQISDAMRKKLLGESVGLGGLPEKPSGGF